MNQDPSAAGFGGYGPRWAGESHKLVLRSSTLRSATNASLANGRQSTMKNDSDGDRRPVATDALATLGTIIDDSAGRDAIHLAVEPVVAGEALVPGARVVIFDDGLARYEWMDRSRIPVGIVDPFLPRPVEEGQRFWLVLLPRTITSLRHVWSHPAFPDEPTLRGDRAMSERWLRDFAARSDVPGYEEMVGAALEADARGRDYVVFGTDAHGDIPPEFWDHLERVVGRRIHCRASFFSCAC